MEGLADRFEPALCDAYVKLFSQAVACVAGLDAAWLEARYERVRRVRPWAPAQVEKDPGHRHRAATEGSGHRSPETLMTAPFGRGSVGGVGGPEAFANDPGRVFVLSRVTLGADVAVTSVLLAAAKQRFADAEIVFVGPRKNYELFAGDPRVRHAEVRYVRGGHIVGQALPPAKPHSCGFMPPQAARDLVAQQDPRPGFCPADAAESGIAGRSAHPTSGLRQRLAAWEDLTRLVDTPDSLVIDPDSRLTQLGLLPVCEEACYRFFESRAYGGASARTLPELAAQWASETLGVSGATPYIALADASAKGDHIAVSLGVGENPAKALPEPFEEELLRLLASTGAPLYIDKGAGGEEAARVGRAVARSGAKASYWEGSFAGFAGIIAGSRLYAGYDSAGQHVAAACGVPLISVFAGFPTPRMFDRWRPAGDRCHVIRVEEPDVQAVLERVQAALQ